MKLMTTLGILLDKTDEIMNENPKVNNRSEAAKKRWQQKKSEPIKEILMAQPVYDRNWIYHAEWFTLMAAVLGCFLFVHGEAVHTNDRLDAHIEAINRRVDEANKRSDELHKEFYDLLKEMRK